MTEPYTVLHGGFHKTASTFLQKSLQRNKGRLKKGGVYYVPHRDLRKKFTVPCQQNAYQAIGVKRKTVISDAELQKMTSAFFQPVLRDKPQRLVLSDENLAGHCGNCVKTGQLYRYRGAFMASFAKSTPYPVREIYLSVRNYADFFAAAYVEYFRSLQEDSSQITTTQIMRTRLFNHMPGWNGVINVVSRHFPDAQIYVWRFEDFVADETMAPALLQRLIGHTVDVQTFDAPRGNSKRQSASARAMAELELLAVTEGLPSLVAQRQDIQNRYPRNAQNGRFDPWMPWERAHLDRLYVDDIERLGTNKAVTLLDPAMLHGANTLP
ncbi:hypothetical protein [Yoonia maricola]|nr:hypothetical protein [Yoonia maricola]